MQSFLSSRASPALVQEGLFEGEGSAAAAVGASALSAEGRRGGGHGRWKIQEGMLKLLFLSLLQGSSLSNSKTRTRNSKTDSSSVLTQGKLGRDVIKPGLKLVGSQAGALFCQPAAVDGLHVSSDFLVSPPELDAAEAAQDDLGVHGGVRCGRRRPQRGLGGRAEADSLGPGAGLARPAKPAGRPATPKARPGPG